MEVGDIVQLDGQQYLLSSDQQGTYLCENGDIGIVVALYPEIDQVELMVSGEMMCAYSNQVKHLSISK